MDVERHRRSGGPKLHSNWDSWCVHPKPKISRDVLNPEIRGAKGTPLDVPNAAHRTYLFSMRVRIACTPRMHTSLLSLLTHRNSKQGHATLTKDTTSPCPQVTSLTQVQVSSVIRLPLISQPIHPNRWGKGFKEGRTKANPFLEGASPQCIPAWEA